MSREEKASQTCLSTVQQLFYFVLFFLTLETIALLEEKTQEGSGSGRDGGGTLFLLHRGQSLGGAEREM